MSKIEVDEVVNQTGDNDSGLDLSANDVVAVKTANTERMRIDASGNVGIGTTPSQALHVSASNPFLELQGTATSSGDTGIFLNANGNHWIVKADNYGSTNAFQIKQGDTSSSTTHLTLNSSGITVPQTASNTTGSSANVRVTSGGEFAKSTSSRRYKNTINDATHGLADLLKLRSVTFKGNTDGDTIFGGLIAEEVHDAGLTEFVEYDDQNRPDALHYTHMVALCVKAIQELKTELDNAKARITALEGK